MRSWLLILTMIVAPLVLADVYKTVDKDGRVIYTDTPDSDKAEKVELRELNTVPGPPPLPVSTPVGSFTSRPASISYKVEIISPRSEATIPVGQRDLAIALTLNSPLKPGHLLVYFINGELLEETTMTNIIVKDIPRGTHKLVAEVIDASGQSLGTSAPVTVNVIRPVIKKNAPSKPLPK